MFTFKRRIVFLRHGRTDWNDSLRYQGKSDIPLNQEGEEEAGKAAIRLSSYLPDVVYTSPLQRALQTTRIISEYFTENPTLRIRQELSEIGFGDWEGRSIRELESESSDVYLRWRADPTSVIPPGGESFEEIQARVQLFISEISAEDSSNILVVSHGGIIRTALIALIGMDPSMLWSLRLNNCAISIVDSWSHVNTLVLWNDHNHIFLREEEIPFLSLPL